MRRRWLAHVLILTTVTASAVGTIHLDESRTAPAAPEVAEEAQSAAPPPPPPPSSSSSSQPLETRADFSEASNAGVVSASGPRGPPAASPASMSMVICCLRWSRSNPAANLVRVPPRAQSGSRRSSHVRSWTCRDATGLLGQGRLEEPSTNRLAGALYLADYARLLHADLSDQAELELVLDWYSVGTRAVAEWAATGTWLDGTDVESTLPVETVEHGARIASAYERAHGDLSNAQIAGQGWTLTTDAVACFTCVSTPPG